MRDMRDTKEEENHTQNEAVPERLEEEETDGARLIGTGIPRARRCEETTELG